MKFSLFSICYRILKVHGNECDTENLQHKHTALNKITLSRLYLQTFLSRRVIHILITWQHSLQPGTNKLSDVYKALFPAKFDNNDNNNV